MKLRTTDLTYGEEYWQTLDGGAGYHDSMMWADLAHAVWEVFVPDRTVGLDRSGEHRCLDLGCAFGFFVRHMNRRGVETFGVDFSRYALDRVPDDVTGRVQFHDLTSADLTFYGTGFSIVTCFETLEHIPEDGVLNALRCVRDSLTDDGRAVLTICTDAQPGWDSDPSHVTIRSRAWWAQQLAAAGLVELQEPEVRLRSFWLFSRHDGLFVVSRRRNT